jgi:hypothetical protein
MDDNAIFDGDGADARCALQSLCVQHSPWPCSTLQSGDELGVHSGSHWLPSLYSLRRLLLREPITRRTMLVELLSTNVGVYVQAIIGRCDEIRVAPDRMRTATAY